MAQRDLRRVKRAVEKLNKARDELAEAILAAQESGESLRDIAPWAELSYSRIHQVLREAQSRRQQSE